MNDNEIKQFKILLRGLFRNFPVSNELLIHATRIYSVKVNPNRIGFISLKDSDDRGKVFDDMKITHFGVTFLGYDREIISIDYSDIESYEVI